MHQDGWSIAKKCVLCGEFRSIRVPRSIKMGICDPMREFSYIACCCSAWQMGIMHAMNEEMWSSPQQRTTLGSGLQRPFCLFVCSRGDTRSVTTGSILLKLGQSPINVSRMDYSRILTSKTHLLSECLDRGIRKTSSIGWLQCWWDMKYWVDIFT